MPGSISRHDTREMIERLRVAATEMPLPVMLCLARLLDLDNENLLVFLVLPDIRECISMGLASGDQGALREARAVANRLVGRGYLEFRDLAS